MKNRIICQCTREQGDSDCAIHPLCNNCGESLENTKLAAALGGKIVSENSMFGGYRKSIESLDPRSSPSERIDIQAKLAILKEALKQACNIADEWIELGLPDEEAFGSKFYISELRKLYQ